MTQNAFNLLEQYLSEKIGRYEIRNTKECCICLEETHHRNECNHAICPGCYYDYYNHCKNSLSRLKCPMCRGTFTDTGLIDDHEFAGYLNFSKYTINAIQQKVDITLKSDISEKEKIKEMIDLEKHTVLHYSLITEIKHNKPEFILLNPIEEYLSCLCY